MCTSLASICVVDTDLATYRFFRMCKIVRQFLAADHDVLSVVFGSRNAKNRAEMFVSS